MHARVLCILLALAAAGCGTRPRPSLGGHAGDGLGVPHPFAPDTIEVHPLTRSERNADQKPIILCYVECRDSWGDTCKTVGRLELQLFRGVGDAGVQELTWEIDLSDLDRNLELYDPPTRMYRLPLEGVPEGLATGRYKLRAILRTAGVKGQEIVLRDELDLR